jgi:hypothetical protein
LALSGHANWPPRYEHCSASSELGKAVADGPILFRGIENGHEHVLGAEAGEELSDPPEQRFLLFHGAGVEHGDLDVHGVGARATP